MPETAPLWLDTIVVSNFALAGRLDVLTQRYGRRLCVTADILHELEAGRQAGHAHLEEALRFALAPPVRRVALTRAEWAVCRRLRSTLGTGEASVIALASRRGGVVATDDQAARQACGDLNVRVTGTLGILLAAMKDGRLARAEADAIHARMVAGGFFSPFGSVSDVLRAQRLG